MHQWVLDIEVVLVVEDSDLLILSARCWLLVLVTVGALGRYGDGGQIHWGRGIDRRLWGDCCHDCEYLGVCWSWSRGETIPEGIRRRFGEFESEGVPVVEVEVTTVEGECANPW